MKKLVLILCIGFVACKDSSKSTTTDSAAPNTTNVQNVNGNQPDTMGTMQLDSRTSPDTTAARDSIR